MQTWWTVFAYSWAAVDGAAIRQPKQLSWRQRGLPTRSVDRLPQSIGPAHTVDERPPLLDGAWAGVGQSEVDD